MTREEAYDRAMRHRQQEGATARDRLLASLDRAVELRIKEGRLDLRFEMSKDHMPTYLTTVAEVEVWACRIITEKFPGFSVKADKRNLYLSWSGE